jgi:hypothetical protein
LKRFLLVDLIRVHRWLPSPLHRDGLGDLQGSRTHLGDRGTPEGDSPDSNRRQRRFATPYCERTHRVLGSGRGSVAAQG